MKRTTIFLDDRLLRRLQRLARTRGVSFATVVREAMSRYVAEPSGKGSLPSIAGRFSSGTRDTSARVDELLWRDPHA
ncbi:MAG TPA: ribbon-helix-helix protein, CopG family [Gemmatimonadaceae bacterium]|nr:ribbon-helix-helix protein, CopG family [Gemmatimonadaceae bacterium]